MTSDGDTPSQIDPHAGLCALCAHVRVVRSGRGSTFYLCERSATDRRFAKYPRLPLTSCHGFDRKEPPTDS
jgi:hypothetical protein